MNLCSTVLSNLAYKTPWKQNLFGFELLHLFQNFRIFQMTEHNQAEHMAQLFILLGYVGLIFLIVVLLEYAQKHHLYDPDSEDVQ